MKTLARKIVPNSTGGITLNNWSRITLTTVIFLCLFTLVACASRTAKLESVDQTQQETKEDKPASMSSDQENAPDESSLKQNLSISNGAIAKNVENLKPIEPATKFDEGVEQVFCFTKVLGATTPTHVFHKWFYQDKEVASVKLAVTSSAFRTYSSKHIMQGAMGDWKVMVTDAEGNALGNLEFAIKPATTAQVTKK